MSKYPKRAFVIRLEVGGDTWADALREMEGFVDHLAKCDEDHASKCNMASGGYSSGGFVEITLTPRMTHDVYFDELEKARREEIAK